MSWRRDERGSRWGAPDGGRERRDRDGRDRDTDPIWEMRRSSSPDRCRGSPAARDRDRLRDRDRERERERERREERYRRERFDRRERTDRERERRRSPRADDDVPPPPSPPKISDNYRARSRSREREDRSKNDDKKHEDRDGFNIESRAAEWAANDAKEGDQMINASPGDWFCKCGLYNFKRRQICYRRNCNGNRSEGIVYGGEDRTLPENAGITKRLLFRRLDALTTEEKILEVIKERCSKDILDSIAGITIGRETLTGASKCLAYINFNSIADSTAAHSELVNLTPPLEIDGREVLVSFYNEPKKTHKPQTQDYAAYAAYQMAQTQYASQQQALSEADRVNAAAAVAASAISAAQARSVTWTPANAPAFNTASTQASTMANVPTGDGKTTYTAPDVQTFMYDATSGYYYDPSTGLYYDANTQYFFNSQTNQYIYWDGTTSTYIAASQAQQKPEATAAAEPAEPTEVAPPEEKKKKEKEDKVKVAKKIAKDMERWARTLNQKKENAKSNIVAEQVLDTAASKGSVDIGFSVLSAKPTQPPVVMVRELSPPPVVGDDFLMKNVAEPAVPLDNDNGIIDWVKLTCLLCKRRFPSADVLTKHKTLSDLHKQNLAEFRKKNELLPQSNGYRDRAAERRMKFGEDEPIPIPRKRYEPPEPAVVSHPPPSVVDTIGGKMLQKMGWSEGRGLGKSEQGRINPIEAEQRPQLAGLGQKRGIYTPTPGETYRDTVKKLMIARYKEVVGSEDGN